MMSKVKVRVFNRSGFDLPKYETEGSAGMDIKAMLGGVESLVINPRETKLIKTGLHVELPVGYEFQVRPRSGMALKMSLTILNSPGTIDSDYRGDIGIILNNAGYLHQIITHGERIGQLVLAKVPIAGWEEVETLEELEKTVRGAGGFGHTDDTKTK